MRLVILGGEPLDPRILLDWFDCVPESRCRTVNMFGITETTVHCTWKTVTRAEALASRCSVGTPIPGWRVFVLDDRLRVVPPGSTGEICVAGVGVARGYLGRPELTRERFVFHHDLNERLYLSGDFGRVNEDGEIEHLGRRDDQVKIHGHRIELGEIRSALLTISGVRDAFLVVADDDLPDATRSLRAYVATDREMSSSEIRNQIDRILPHYMLPASISVLSRIPLTTNGKVDVQALPKPESSKDGREPDDPDDLVPATQLEMILSEAWSLVLGRPSHPDENFFDLGGDSVRAARLQQSLSKAGLEIKLVDIFKNPTRRELALQLDARRSVPKESAGAP